MMPAPSYLQDTQVWRYFPLGPEEEIKEISVSDNDQFEVSNLHIYNEVFQVVNLLRSRHHMGGRTSSARLLMKAAGAYLIT